jgi:hypothetical protein
MRRRVTILVALAALTVGTVTLVQATAGAGEPAQPSAATTSEPSGGSSAGSPAEYAQVAFDAWQGGDAVTLIRQANLPAAQLLLARQPGEETWAGPACEGGAGSTYCAWEAEASQDVLPSQLVLRVGNEDAVADEPHALGEAFFARLVDHVAIWPLTTAEEAEHTQASVDEGHSPWMVDPATVVESFAAAELGWEEPVVEPLAVATYRVTDSATGVAATVDVAQPAREGSGGIWAVIRLGSGGG